MVNDLLEEHADITSGISEFGDYPDEQILIAANAPSRSGVPTIEAFRTTGEIARKYLYGDLRKKR